MVIVPVAGRERPVGALTLVTAPGRRGLRPADLDTAHAVAQRIAAAAERQRMLEQLRQSERLEAVAQLAAGVAHDFNNLLTVILGSTEAAQRRLDQSAERPLWADALRDDITAVDRAGRRAAALTAQLLDLARPASSPLEELDPDEVMLALLPALGQLVGSGVVVEHRRAYPEVRIRAERIGLERALLNLAANARDAMPSGGRLTVTTIAPAEPRSRSVGVSASDTGTGMDEATAARCFEPFFTTKQRSRGTGLGLAGVASFVAGTGGDVTVDTAPGQGCTLTMWFPVGNENQGSTR
jgi:signal transduction histidine kinase